MARYIQLQPLQPFRKCHHLFYHASLALRRDYRGDYQFWRGPVEQSNALQRKTFFRKSINENCLL